MFLDQYRSHGIDNRQKKSCLHNKRMDEVCDVDKDQLFHKDYEDKGIAKVLFSEEQPLIFKYNINRELLTVSFHYGYWNSYGVPQH